MAYMAVYCASMSTIAERNVSKPFNPLLGETFEHETDEFECVAEQVSHHPPITANYCRGKKTNYTFWNNQLSKTKFTGKCVDVHHQYRNYVKLDDHNETFEIEMPIFSVHNLIIGTMYFDIGGTGNIKCLEDDSLKCQLRFTKRGWLSREEFKCEGEVVRTGGKKGNNELLYKIHGNWNSKILVTKFNNGKLDTSTTELVFEKNPYPEKWDYMYGLSHFALQLNYFPSWLNNVVAPTDTRRRPDQRSLENGDMINAAKQKERLEEKQRAVRKYREKNEIEHEAAYFVEKWNEEDKQNYFVYNGKYFEEDRKKQDWSRLPDLFSENSDIPE